MSVVTHLRLSLLGTRSGNRNIPSLSATTREESPQSRSPGHRVVPSRLESCSSGLTGFPPMTQKYYEHLNLAEREVVVIISKNKKVLIE